MKNPLRETECFVLGKTFCLTWSFVLVCVFIWKFSRLPGGDRTQNTNVRVPAHSLTGCCTRFEDISLFTGRWPRCLALSLLLIYPNTPQSKTINSLGSFKTEYRCSLTTSLGPSFMGDRRSPTEIYG